MITSSSLEGRSVKTITAIAANSLGKFLAKDFRRVFGPAHDDMAERLGSLARSTIECLARSDALYHNYEQHATSHDGRTRHSKGHDTFATNRTY